MRTFEKGFVERFENDIVIMTTLLCTENQTFDTHTHTTTNYLNYLDMQTIDFFCFLSFSIVFIVFLQTAGNHMKNDINRIFKCDTIVAFSLKTILFSMNTYSCRRKHCRLCFHCLKILTKKYRVFFFNR